MRHQQSSMIHGWVGSILIQRFPFFRAQVEVEGHGRRLGRLAIVANAIVLVGVIASAREIDLLVLLRATAGDPETCRARVIRQLGPLDFVRIVMIDLAHPAFVRGNISWGIARRILAGSIYVNNGPVDYCASVAENRRSRN